MMKKRWVLGLAVGLAMAAAFGWMRGVDSASPTLPVSQLGTTQPVHQMAVEERPDDARSAVGAVPAPESASAEKQVKEMNGDLHEDNEMADLPSPATIEAVRQVGSPVGNEGQPVTLSDGSVQAQLGNRFRSVPVATIGKDGKVHVDYHGEKHMQDKPVESKP